jgi:hypothetical protein
VKNNRPRYIRKRDRVVILAIALYGFCPAVLFAGDIAYGLGYSSEYSSNITQVPVNAQKEWINSVMAGVGYAEYTPDLAARVLSQVQYDKYEYVFGEETLFNLDSSAVWTVSPQRFNWSVQDVYRQLPIDLTVTETPINRENVNVFSTGPDFLLHFSPVQTLVLGARYGNFYTAHTNTDNNNSSGFARWQYQATSQMTYSLNYEVLDVKYKDDVANNNFKQQNLYFRADSRPSRSEYILDLGTTQINQDRNSVVRQGSGKLSWVREINPETNMGASVGAGSSNTGNDVLAASTAAAGPTPSPAPIVQPSAVTSDVYRTKRADAFYMHHSSQFGTSLQVFGQDVNYQLTPDSNRQSGGNLLFSYYYSDTFTSTLFGGYSKTKYTTLIRRDIDRDAGLRFAYRVGRDILMTLEGRRTERASTDPNAPFTENRVLFTVLYSSGPVFRTLSTR